jgi:hypothetical protein
MCLGALRNVLSGLSRGLLEADGPVPSCLAVTLEFSVIPRFTLDTLADTILFTYLVTNSYDYEITWVAQGLVWLGFHTLFGVPGMVHKGYGYGTLAIVASTSATVISYFLGSTLLVCI